MRVISEIKIVGVTIIDEKYKELALEKFVINVGIAYDECKQTLKEDFKREYDIEITEIDINIKIDEEV